MSRLEIPNRDSALAGDDKALGGTPPSEIARLALISATESLQLVRETLDRGRTFVTATNGPIRTALLGASHVVYQLASEDPNVRQERQRFAQRAYYSNMSTYLREQLALQQDPYLVELVKGNTAKIKVLNDVLGYDSRDKPRRGASDTEVVSDAAKQLSERNGAIARIHWRRLGGDAHALGWQLLADGVKKQRTEGNLFEGTLHSDESNTHRHFLTGAAMLKRAWSLFDQRCDEPQR